MSRKESQGSRRAPSNPASSNTSRDANASSNTTISRLPLESLASPNQSLPSNTYQQQTFHPNSSSNVYQEPSQHSPYCVTTYHSQTQAHAATLPSTNSLPTSYNRIYYAQTPVAWGPAASFGNPQVYPSDGITHSNTTHTIQYNQAWSTQATAGSNIAPSHREDEDAGNMHWDTQATVNPQDIAERENNIAYVGSQFHSH